MSQIIGSVLDGKYELVRLIGEGGMGSVYEANHKLIGRRLAVKFLHPQYASSEEVVTRFQREAQAAAQIGHENIIEVTDMGTAGDGSPYLVMEFLEGCDVRQLIEEEGKQDPKRVAHIMVQALGALQAAHNVGIIHRDLKPENIFLIEKGGNPDYVKLLDFGISKFRSLESDGAKGLTQTGTVLGTPHYMSPEQARGEQNLSPRSDIYAMGVILYQMLTGELPFDAPNYNALLIKILTEEPAPVEQLCPDLPSELIETANISMCRDPAGRFQSCEEFRERLIPFAPGAAAIGTRMTTASRTAIRQALYSTKTPFEMTQSGIDAKRRKKLPFAIGAGVFVVALLVLAGVFFFTGESGKASPTDPNARVAGAEVEKQTPKDLQPGDKEQNSVGSDTEKKVETPAVEEVETIVLKVKATPQVSEIRIDGAKVGGNPFEGPFAKNDALRTIEVVADGYEPIKELVKFNSDLSLSYNLKKNKKKKGGKTTAVEPEDQSKKGTKKTGKKSTRKIDYDDPWNQ